MKDKIKEILIHQLNECKIEPMEYIEYNKFVDRMTNEQLNRVASAIASRYPKAISNTNNKIQSLVQKRVMNPNKALSINNKINQLKQHQSNMKVKGSAWFVKSKSKI